MKLRLTPRAAASLILIADDIRGHNPVAAERVREDIRSSLKTLVIFPKAGRRQKVKGVRRLITRTFRYLIYYTIDDAHEEIVVLRIRDPARRREHQNA
jgi:plasmid stabilization system protein ParE